MTTTKRTFTVELSEDVCWALWAAMWDDDDLASDYAERAVVLALSMMRDSAFWKLVPLERRIRINDSLETAREKLIDSIEDAVSRWERYAEPH